MPINAQDREFVRNRAQYSCEYCQRLEEIVGSEFEIDHLEPQSQGGTDDLDNLALACPDCNAHKSDRKSCRDPASKQKVPLYNPRNQLWKEHFRWSDDKTELLGLSPIGRATIDCFQLNNPLVMRARKGWVKLGWPPA
jgi:hypothetical protein